MKRRLATWVVVLICLVLLLALLMLCLLGFWYTRRVDQARAVYAPPTVIITEPAAGMSAPAGSYVSISATAVGLSPITRAELWVDGELAQTQDSPRPEGISPLYAYFDLLLTEGSHLLLVRAVDVAGVLGQSAPVGIVGGPKPSQGETFLAVTSEEGQTLADIAASYQTDSETLQELNPGLGDQEPPAGTLVAVPAPPDTEEPEEPSAPTVTPTPTPVAMPDIPPLQAIRPSPNMTSTVPLPAIVGSLLPKLAAPVFTPPAAPTNLQGSVDNCKVRLRWNDNAWNESRYDVWMAVASGSSTLIASLQQAAGGAAWVEFAAPQPGGLSFWVEAVNSVGKQPSNIVHLLVPTQCPSTMPTQLQVDVLDMTVRGSFDRTYCYFSLENRPEMRMPADDSAFVQVQGGRGDTAALSTGGRKLVIPIPADNSLEITGECWGWAGDDLTKLGPCGGKYPAATWDGARRPLEGEAVQMSIALTLLGGGGATGGLTTYGYEDPSLPVPYDLREARVGSESSLDPQEEWEWFWQRQLSWQWNGDPSKITGFAIYVDGKAYKSVSASSRAEVVTLPNYCGATPQWQVAAVAGTTQSRLSAALGSTLPTCPMYAMVEFDWVYFRSISDPWGDCDTADGYFDLGANMLERSFWGGNFFVDLECGKKFSFANIPQSVAKGPHTNRFIVPVYTYQDGTFCVIVSADFWDYDPWTANDWLSSHQDWLCYTSLQEAQGSLGCGKSFHSLPLVHEDGYSDLQYRVTIFPNKCSQYPPTS